MKPFRLHPNQFHRLIHAHIIPGHVVNNGANHSPLVPLSIGIEPRPLVLFLVRGLKRATKVLPAIKHVPEHLPSVRCSA